jgi:predicted ATPase
MVMRRLTELRAKEFRSLADVTIPLAPLTVLVGPNGSGKSNVLNMLRFLASTVRFDLASAIDEWGGFDHIKRQAGKPTSQVSLGVTGQITQHSSQNALDIYDLSFRQTARGTLTRSETFQFKRTKGRGRRITISGDRAEFSGDDHQPVAQRLANSQTTGLATLPKLADDQGGEGIRALAEFLSSLRVLEPDVSEARTPARMISGPLADDASNLAAALHRLSTTDEDAFGALQSDLRYCLQGLDAIEFQSIGGPGKSVAVVLRERGVRQPVELADASFGTVRLLAILTALHEPDPPPFTAIEEIDHGLHPYAIDILVDRMRRAAEHTQLLIATHSPTLVNRLRPEELVVCGRDPETGASLIPMMDSAAMLRAVEASELGLGELWFAGAIGGVPELV